MEIGHIQPTAKVTYPVGGETVTLEVTLGGLDTVVDIAEVGTLKSQLNRAFIAKNLVGWDITENGAPLPCTDENRALVLPHILGQRTPDVTLEDGTVERGYIVGFHLLAFIMEPSNFIKK